MALRCLDSIKDANGNTVNLFTINDFSIIPQQVIDNPTYMHHIKLTPFTMTKPAYLNNGGSYYMEVNSGTNDTKYFIQSEDMELVVGKYINQYSTTMRGYGFNYNSNEWFYIMGYANIGNIIYDIGFCIVIDEDNQRAYLLEVTYTLNHGPDGYEIWISGGKKDGHDIIYEAIYGQIITYTWQSVPSISGKNGILSFSMVNDIDLNNGDPVTNADASAIHRLENSTNIGVLCQNMPYNVETPIIYAGSVDYMSIEKIGGPSGGFFVDVGPKLRFYMAGSSVPFYETGNLGNNYYLHFIIDDENEVAKLSLIYRNTQVTPITYAYNRDTFTDEQMHSMWLWLHSHLVPEDEEDETSTDLIGNGDEGGESYTPWNSYNIPQGSNPSKGALNTGFTTMYFIDDTTLRSLSDFLWSESFVENVKKFFSDPREIIVGLLVHPITPNYQETLSEIKAGRISTGVSAHKLTNQYKTIDMGVINMHEVTHTFLDYAPYTKASIYLPYCGEHALDLSDIQNSELHLYYTFDFLTGAVCAKISVDGNFKYNFTGQCGVQIPTSSEDFSRMYSSVLSAGATLGSAIATIATGGMTAPLLIGSGANMLANGVNMTPDVQYSSGGAGSSGFISTQTPFLKLDLPVPLMANNDTSEEETESSKQYSFVGKTTYQNLKLSNCNGYTKCMEVHLTGIHATDKELSQIENDLLNGVIIKNGNETPSDVPSVEGNTVITFLKCKSEKNVIGKSWETGETNIKTVEGHLIYNQSITNPKFIIEGDVIGFNYCYIPIFKRFYYVNDIVVKEGLIEEISMSVDPLQSFKTDIKKCKAIVERQETKGNLYMSDSYMWTKAKREVVTVPFTAITYDYIDENGVPSFPRANNSYILTIAGSD